MFQSQMIGNLNGQLVQFLIPVTAQFVGPLR